MDRLPNAGGGSPLPVDVDVPAPSYPRNPKSARFHAILTELGLLHDKKQMDYGRASDPFANVRATEAFGIPAWVGAAMRANDKMIRIQKFAQDKVLANESLEDSLRDLAVYAVISLVLFEEWRDGQR